MNVFQRRGRFFLPDLLIDQDPDLVMKMMSFMIPYRVEHDNWDRGTYFRCYSTLFSPLPVGYPSVNYDIEWCHDNRSIVFRNAELNHHSMVIMTKEEEPDKPMMVKS